MNCFGRKMLKKFKAMQSPPHTHTFSSIINNEQFLKLFLGPLFYSENLRVPTTQVFSPFFAVRCTNVESYKGVVDYWQRVIYNQCVLHFENGSTTDWKVLVFESKSNCLNEWAECQLWGSSSYLREFQRKTTGKL